MDLRPGEPTASELDVGMWASGACLPGTRSLLPTTEPHCGARDNTDRQTDRHSGKQASWQGSPTDLRCVTHLCLAVYTVHFFTQIFEGKIRIHIIYMGGTNSISI